MVAIAAAVAVCGLGACADDDQEATVLDTTPAATPQSVPEHTSKDAQPDIEARTTDATGTSSRPEGTADAQTGGVTLVASPDLTPPRLEIRDALFPLAVSPDGRYVEDRSGVPFLIHGDAAWSLIVQLDLAETDVYLDARRAQGFNTLVVNLIEHHFADDPPRNAAGNAPFETEGDFTTPNAEYFDHAAEVIRHAADRGFAVLLAPAYLGYDGGDEGWYAEMSDNGVEALREYGRFVGERLGGLDNIIWLLGGDYTPEPEGVELVDAVQQGLVDGGARQLQTAHWGPETSAADVPVDWLDLNTTYTYGLVYERSAHDDQHPGGLAHFLIESAYEDDIKDVNPTSLRAQAYDALLTGAAGQVFGHGDIWQFNDDWSEALDSPGGLDMVRVRTLFDGLPWTELEFDVDQRLLVDGSGAFGDNDYAVAAGTPDGSTAVVYVPTERVLELDLDRLDGELMARWYDPTSGVYTAASATVVDDRIVRVEPQGANSAGDGDWILVVEPAK